MENKNEIFTYSYSAHQQEELKKIRNKYIPKEESKMEQLKRLDKRTERPGTITAITVGLIGTLMLGVGMCCTMIWADKFFILGVIIGIIGIAIVSIAYPLYKNITKKQRAKVAAQIIELTDALMQNK